MMNYIVDYYTAFIKPKKGLDPKESELFFTSSIGLKIWNIVTKVNLLIMKSVVQEWFTINNYLEIYPKKNIPGELEDDRIYFNRLFNSCLSSSAFVPATIPNFIPHTRESLISSIYFVIYSLRNVPDMTSEFLNYMEGIVREYPIIKERYLNAKIIAEDNYQMIYEQDKQFTFLENKYSEQEFDWFEDIETNLPLNLNSLIKLVEAYLYFPQDIDKYYKLLDESLKIDLNNFYTLFLKANNARFSPVKDDKVKELAIEVKELCERGLEILKKAKHLPLREEISCNT